MLLVCIRGHFVVTIIFLFISFHFTSLEMTRFILNINKMITHISSFSFLLLLFFTITSFYYVLRIISIVWKGKKKPHYHKKKRRSIDYRLFSSHTFPLPWNVFLISFSFFFFLLHIHWRNTQNGLFVLSSSSSSSFVLLTEKQRKGGVSKLGRWMC